VLSSDAGTPELARQIPGAHYRMLPGMGHFGPSENPVGFRKFLAPVLDEIHTKYAGGAA
jgi:pimeloyl-ACP methyl ester carboxylesterase